MVQNREERKQVGQSVGGDRLIIEGMEFHYTAGIPIFKGLNLEVEPGEFVAMLGPSGCGKTTLLNLLSGFYSPTKGSIRLRGQPVKPEDPHLGYVFQQSNLSPWLTAIENVEFGLKMENRMDKKAMREKAEVYLDMVGLAAYADYLPSRLSGGMQQRVSLARALVLEPHLLLMDEPFAALDAITRETMNDELLRLWEELGQTVLFITHDIDEAIYLSDRVLVLSRPPHGIYREKINELPRPRSGPTTRTHDLFWQYKKEMIEDIARVTENDQQSTQNLRRTA